MDSSNPYFRQVQLLVNTIPMVAKQECFALKGGTAINLFYRDLPRLSVDIDLTYLPNHDRNESLAGIRDGLTALAQDLRNFGAKVKLQDGESSKVFVRHMGTEIKIETSPVLRGTVHGVSRQRVLPKVEEHFGFAEMQVLDFKDIYAGKICAALDRQHPRDLFDVRQLLENEGLDADLKNTFLVYLLSHGRPMAEVLSPNLLDITDIFLREFDGMTAEPVALDDLCAARAELISRMHAMLTDQDKAFLMSFKQRNPDWSLFAYPQAKELPAVRWKMQNLSKMDETKHQESVEKLASVLGL